MSPPSTSQWVVLSRTVAEHVGGTLEICSTSKIDATLKFDDNWKEMGP